MAFPAIRASTVTNGTTATASPVINLPATVKAGDTLVVYFRSAAAGAITFPAAWTELVDAAPDASGDQIAIAWKKADGSESGTTITLSAANAKFAAISRSIQAATDPTIRAPQISTVAVGTTGEPNATTVTPTGGAKDYLWDTVFFMEGEQTGITANPTSYTLDQQFANSGTAGAVTTNCTIGAVGRTANAASEDAGVWDVAGTLDDSAAYTLAFHPAEAVPAPLQTEYPQPNPAPRPSASMVALTIASTLLTSTLYAQASMAPPPAQHHWPVPSPWPSILLTTHDTLPPEVAAAPATPVVPLLWPNPQTKPPTGHLRFVEYYVLDQNEPAATQSLVLPPRRPPRPLTWTQNLLESTLASAEAPIEGVHGTDQVVYLRGPGAMPVWRAPNLLVGGTLAAPEAPPHRPLAWPNPLSPGRLGLTWTFSRFGGTIEPLPVGQAVWEVPAPRPLPPPRPWPLPLQQSTLAPAAPASSGAPVSTVLVPDFGLKPPPPPFDPPNLLVATLSVPPAAPVVPKAWPNPQPHRQPPLTWTQVGLALVVPPPAFPTVSQHAWPNPAPIRPLRELRTWTDRRFPGLVDARILRMDHWPVPTRRPVPTLSWLQEALRSTAPAAPIVPPSWPVPGHRRALTWTWTQDGLRVAGGTPVRPIDWPLPRRSVVATRAAWANLTILLPPGAPTTTPPPILSTRASFVPILTARARFERVSGTRAQFDDDVAFWRGFNMT